MAALAAVIMHFDQHSFGGGKLTALAPALGHAYLAVDMFFMRNLGEISFSIYLWHAPVHFAFDALLPRFGVRADALAPEDRALVLVAMLGVLLAIGAASYHLFEAPARRWVRLVLDPRPGRGV